MKAKSKAIVLIALLVAVVAAFGVFFGINDSKIEGLFNDTVKALDTSEGLKELFFDSAVSDSFDKDVEELYDFYKGTSVKIKDFKMYHESTSNFRAYATVETDESSYFICISASGARMVDPTGINQIIIEDGKDFKNKKIFKKKTFGKYLSHAKKSITIRRPGDY